MALTGTLAPTADEQALADQIEYANLLRRGALDTGGKMVGRHYVAKSPWENAIEGFTSGYMGSSARGKQAEIEALRDKQFQDLTAAAPTAHKTVESWTPEQMAMGPTNEAPLGTRQVLKPAAERQVELQNYANKLLASRDPRAQQMAGTYLTQAMALPDKEADIARDEEKERVRNVSRVAERDIDFSRRQAELKAAEDRADARQKAADARADKREARAAARAEANFDRQLRKTLAVEEQRQKLKAGGKKGDTAASIDLAETGIALVDRMIGERDEKGALKKGAKPHPGFETYVGATMFPGLRFIEGGDTATFEGMEKQVKGQAMLEAYQAIRGTGAISNTEGKSATDALNRMNKALNEDEYVKAALEFRNIMRRGVDRLKSGNVAPAASADAAGTPENDAGWGDL